MSNVSDEDTFTSKRPKTKLQSLKNSENGTENVSDGENDSDSINMRVKSGSVSFNEINKKASKRMRESDEESSISSEEEVMSKKRVRKSSEEEVRLKRRVSTEARKRREAARSVREKNMTASDSDSDSESEKQKSHKGSSTISPSSKNKPIVDDILKKLLSDSENEGNMKLSKSIHLEAQKKEIVSKKDEDSSSAYNSDSEGVKSVKKSAKNSKFEGQEMKQKQTNASESECEDSSSYVNNKHENVTVDSKKTKTCETENEETSDEEQKDLKKRTKCTIQVSGSESDGKELDLDKNHKLPSKEEKIRKLSNKSSDNELDVQISPIKGRDKLKTTVKKNDMPPKSTISSDSGSDNDPLLKSDKGNKCENISENSSSENERISKKSKSPSLEKTTVEIKNETSSAASDSDDRPLKVTKPCPKKSRKLAPKKAFQSQDTSSSSNEDNSDKDVCKSKLKTEPHKNVGKRDCAELMDKQSRKTEDLSHSSDEEKPLKKAKSPVRTKKNDSVKTKSKSSRDGKPQYSNSDDSDRPLKKTKSSNKKVRKGDDSSNSNSSEEKLSRVKSITVAQKSLKMIKTLKASDDSSDETNKSSDSLKGCKKIKKVKNKTRKIDSNERKKKGNSSSEVESESEVENDRKKNIQPKKEVCVQKKDSDESDKDFKSFVAKADIDKVGVKKNEKDGEGKHYFSDTTNSDDSEKEKKLSKTKSKSSEEKKKELSSSDASDSNSEHEKKSEGKERKSAGKWEVKINNFKKYIRAAGIRINNYTSLWEGCKNDKQRADKLQKVLEENGLQGRPSLKKCKKIREKLERKREVEALDLNNIIDDGKAEGRGTRRRTRLEKPSEVNQKEKAAEVAAELKQRFSRIRDIIGSDSSSG